MLPVQGSGGVSSHLLMCTHAGRNIEGYLCRVLRELLGSTVAERQGEPLQRKHLLSKALKRAHNSLGNHQLVSQARRTAPAACKRSVMMDGSTVTCHRSTC